MAILDQPISWRRSPTREGIALLSDVQANILKSHGRPAVRLILFEFHNPDSGRRLLKELTPLVTTAFAQLSGDSQYGDRRAGTVTNLLVTGRGYRRLGRDRLGPQAAVFVAGMRARAAQLNDPDRFEQEVAYREARIDGMVAVAGFGDSSSYDEIDAAENSLWRRILPHAAVLGSESGMARYVGRQSVEPFGYADGISQPRFLIEDRMGPASRTVNHLLPLKNVLLADPAGGPNSFGSFLVLRKLQQNLEAFNESCAVIAARGFALGSDAVSAIDLAGAKLIGRFRDGTPLSIAERPLGIQPPPNDISRVGDRGRIQSHSDAAADRSKYGRGRMFPRRGIPYGRGPGGEAAYLMARAAGEDPPNEGLLFMCYNSDIEEQFEYAQQQINKAEAANRALIPGIQQFVTFRGGEYFFAPSISGLRALGKP